MTSACAFDNNFAEIIPNMPIPTHRDSCLTKAFPTNCPDCAEEVWYFSCNCGSKVYFTHLGWPWDEHKCKNRVLREAIQLIKISDRLSDEEIYSRIDLFSKERGWDIPESIVELLDNELVKRRYPLKVSLIMNLTNISDVSGKVMEINRDVSFIKRLKIDPNKPIQRSLAGDLLLKSYSEIIVRENPNEKNECSEYRLYAEKDYLKRNPININKTILANIKKMKSSLAELWKITEHQCY